MMDSSWRVMRVSLLINCLVLDDWYIYNIHTYVYKWDRISNKTTDCLYLYIIRLWRCQSNQINAQHIIISDKNRFILMISNPLYILLNMKNVVQRNEKI